MSSVIFFLHLQYNDFLFHSTELLILNLRNTGTIQWSWKLDSAYNSSMISSYSYLIYKTASLQAN